MYHLACNADKQEKLFQELREVLGPEAKITEANYPKLKYLKVSSSTYKSVQVSNGQLKYLKVSSSVLRSAHSSKGQLNYLKVSSSILKPAQLP